MLDWLTSWCKELAADFFGLSLGLLFALRVEALGDEVLDIAVALLLVEVLKGLEVFSAQKFKAGDEFHGICAEVFWWELGDGQKLAAAESPLHGKGEHDEQAADGEDEDGNQLTGHGEKVRGSAMTLKR